MMLQAMFAALLYGTSGLALTSIGLLGLMAATAFTSIFFAVIGGESEYVSRGKGLVCRSCGTYA